MMPLIQMMLNPSELDADCELWVDITTKEKKPRNTVNHPSQTDYNSFETDWTP